MAENEILALNNRLLMLGVLATEDGSGYQLYTAPGMSVAEIAFDVMVIIRLMLQDGYLKSKEEFDALVQKYFTDPQYAPLETEKEETSNEQD